MEQSTQIRKCLDLRQPDSPPLIARVISQAGLVRAIGIHNVYLPVPVSVGGKRQAGASRFSASSKNRYRCQNQDQCDTYPSHFRTSFYGYFSKHKTVPFSRFHYWLPVIQVPN